MMENYPNLLKSAAQIQRVLSDAGIDSMAIGGLAVAIWGDPRVTRDVDLKVLLQRDRADQLVAALPKDLQCLSDQPEDTLRRIGFLFARDTTGIRIDFLLAETEFDIAAVARQHHIEINGENIAVCSPEDLIIYKMISTRSRDHDDAQGVIRRQRIKLDDRYITSWLVQFERALDDSTLVNSYRRMRGAQL